MYYHFNTKHPGIERYGCEVCDYKCGLKSDLLRHVKDKHTPKEDMVYKCDQCTFKSEYKTSLINHINTKHLNIKQFKCDACKYESGLRGNLKRHVKAKHMKEVKK